MEPGAELMSPHPDSSQGVKVHIKGLGKRSTSGLGLATHGCPDVLRPQGPKGLSVHTAVLERLHGCQAVPGTLPSRRCSALIMSACLS